ncbi:class I ribonucleotide reductase maintenance protein YfaE [Buchnera aphidicola]|uniref:2Fe-2S iron-sulfur cluster binding domain-containing protein n=1 Tax=Buchnera aphidicola subsp. Uroleucon sonchi TaxID=118118 RepID=A0A6C1FB65_BUCUN|nr:class I ribonucleotide reductase maintenance protein YfaE [Buchnera aphidicola]QIE01917.1 2Fe-2S iron-sulfur cluster binding domain-containing protein [Buchnera aphidicola (Uroleucon sonchi)]
MKYNTITIININKKIVYKNNLSLLSILKKNKIYIEHQCCSGYCGSCRINLIKGQVYYLIKQPMAALFNKKEILPCCCKPDSNIIIKI